jgi:phage portal protein BeeE
MGVASWFRGLFGGQERAASDFMTGRWAMAPMRRGTPQLLQAYKEMPWLQTIVDTVSDSVADVRWKVYRPTSPSKAAQKSFALQISSIHDVIERRAFIKDMVEAGEAEEVTGHPLLSLMCDPNDYLTGRQVAKLVQTHLDLVGEAFLPLDLQGKVPVGYWPLPPSAVIALPDYMLPPEDQVFRVNFGRVAGVIPADRMLHLRHPDPEDPLGRGVGRAFSLGDELDTDEYAARFTKNFFYNNTIPAALISIEGMNTAPPAVQAWKDKLNHEHGGPDNAGKVMVTSGKTSIARLDTDFQKMDYDKLRKSLNGFIRMCYRVPPEIVGDIGSSNKATAYAARENLAEQCTVPRAEFMRSEYQKRLMPRFGRPGDVLDFESPVPADSEFTLRVMGTFPSSFTGNEARALAGKKPRPDMDEPLSPLPGQSEADPKTPDAPQGSATDTAEEEKQPSNKKNADADPPWARESIL